MESEKRPQFGNRYLTDQDDVFKHNAWDDVEWTEEQEQEAKMMVEKNSSSKFTEVERERLRVEADVQWDNFYKIHRNRFFKDRNWLFTEFPELNEIKEGNILELGCGAGNTVYPILESNISSGLKVYCCDFAASAIEAVKEHALYEEGRGRVHPFILDMSQEDWSESVPFPEESLDIVILVFALSALEPSDMKRAIDNIKKYLKPGGLVLFRDYGRYDLAQLRFKPGKCLDANFYARGDGTKCFFFEEDDVKDLFCSKDFGLEQLKVDRRLQVNRATQQKMYRVWIQCKFRKTSSANKAV